MRYSLALLFFVGLMIFSATALAQSPMKDRGHPMMGGAGHGHGHGYGRHGYGHRGGHMFSRPWMATLSDEQRLKIDKLHLELGKKQATLKAKKKVLKTELKLMILEDKPDTNAINKKIDEITDIKNKLMKNKYAHKVDMRTLLTPEQRITFDLGMVQKLNRHKGKGKHHRK